MVVTNNLAMFESTTYQQARGSDADPLLEASFREALQAAGAYRYRYGYR